MGTVTVVAAVVIVVDEELVVFVVPEDRTAVEVIAKAIVGQGAVVDWV